MSSANRIGNVGASARASDFQAVADIASAADDRALEIVFTPGAAQKKIAPLSDETTTTSPTLLIVGKDTDGTLANGKVRVRPAHFIAGVLNDPNTIGLAGKLDALLDSALFANNSSGVTRTDLLYATLSYGAAVTASVRQKPTAGGAPISATLTIENDITVTLGIVANVASGSPLASLPADSGSGKAAVYNFGLAAVSIANGFSGGAINQASITPLWTKATISHSLVRGLGDGTRSVAALVVDGTGEQIVTPTPGTVVLSALAGGTSTPTPAIPRKKLYADMIPIAGGQMNASGVLIMGFGVTSVTHSATGEYDIQLQDTTATAANTFAVVTAFLAGCTAIYSLTGSVLSIFVKSTLSGNAAVDNGSSFVVYRMGS